jgi:hypothetical protein
MGLVGCGKRRHPVFSAGRPSAAVGGTRAAGKTEPQMEHHLGTAEHLMFPTVEVPESAESFDGQS